ncbi:hypothetical protein BHE74_00028218, partial [Ensete ventricosum]
CRYADCPLLGGTAKNQLSAVDLDHRCRLREKSTVGGRLREIGGRLREIGDQRKREEEEEEKKHNLYNRRPCAVAREPSPPRGRPCAVAAHTRGRFFSRVGRKIEVTIPSCSPIFFYIYLGLLWTHSRKGNGDEQVLHASTLAAHEKAHSPEDTYNENVLTEAISADSEHPLNTYTPVTYHDKHIQVVVGSILAATDKLFNAVPFDNSTVLIVTMDKNQGFQGLIINKRISWDIFKELDSDLVSLKHAQLYYGGPVRFQTLPLVSLIWKAKEGYTEIVKGVYFGNPVVTRQVIEEIKLKEESPDDYWFFLGFSSWGYDQLFEEITEGAWQLSRDPIEHLDWAEN